MDGHLQLHTSSWGGLDLIQRPTDYECVQPRPEQSGLGLARHLFAGQRVSTVPPRPFIVPILAAKSGSKSGSKSRHHGLAEVLECDARDVPHELRIRCEHVRELWVSELSFAGAGEQPVPASD